MVWKKGHSGGGNGGAVVDVSYNLRVRVLAVYEQLKSESWCNTWARAAREMGLCHETLCRIVNGRIKRIRAKTLAAIERWIETHDATGRTKKE